VKAPSAKALGVPEDEQVLPFREIDERREPLAQARGVNPRFIRFDVGSRSTGR